MKRTGPLVLALLVLAVVLVWLGGGILGGPGGTERRAAEPYEPPALAPIETTPSGPLPPARPAAPHLAGSADAPPLPEPTAPEPAEPAPEPSAPADEAVAAVYTGALPPGWADAEPAQRPHAIRPPGGKGPQLGGGGRGGVGPTGHWTRFPPPPPPKGDADVLVVVSDEEGRPVAEAAVYLGPPAALHEQAVSFGDLRKIGSTGPDGRLLVRGLPAGAAALAGNVANRLNGPRGLDMRSSIPVLLLDGTTVRAELALPLSIGDFGRITGRVADFQGRPIRRAAAVAGYQRVYTDDDGHFALAQVPAGTQTVSVSRTGYTQATLEVEVPAGGAQEVLVTLSFAESGPLRLEGTVLATEGGPVPGAVLYLIDETRRGTLRSVTSDDAGRYVFEDLHERLAKTACRVQAGKHQAGYRAALIPFPDGISLSDSRLDITLPPRQVQVRFVLRDAASGHAVDRCRVEVARTDDPEVNVRGFLGTDALGRFEHWYDAGAYRFTIEAPDHHTQTVDVVLEGPGATAEVPVAMLAMGEEGHAVTLRLRVTDDSTEEPVVRCTIDLLDPAPSGQAVARFEGRAPDGAYSMPAPSGRWRLRIQAEGYEDHEEPLDLPPDTAEHDHPVRLRPR